MHTDPGQAVLAGHQILVEGLVHVPQKDESNGWHFYSGFTMAVAMTEPFVETQQAAAAGLSKLASDSSARLAESNLLSLSSFCVCHPASSVIPSEAKDLRQIYFSRYALPVFTDVVVENHAMIIKSQTSPEVRRFAQDDRFWELTTDPGFGQASQQAASLVMSRYCSHAPQSIG